MKQLAFAQVPEIVFALDEPATIPNYVKQMRLAAHFLNGTAIHDDPQLTAEAATFAIANALLHLQNASAMIRPDPLASIIAKAYL